MEWGCQLRFTFLLARRKKLLQVRVFNPDAAALADLQQLIRLARAQVAQAVNSALVLLYWEVGRRTRTNILGEKRAEYGEEILPTLSAKLVPEFGQGFSPRNLARMIRFAEVFPDHLDLLFYHRILRRLIAVELKLEKLKPADKGQMELYLRWLEKYEMRPGEEKPLGLILCSTKDDEQVKLLELDQSGIRVATYLTELPARQLLKKRLHEAVELAQSQLDNRPEES